MNAAHGYELLLGPGGSGKSRRLRDLFVQALRAGREAETLLLVPTASYRDHTRNLVLRESGIRGFSGAGVCTFRDLLRRLVPPEPGEELSSAHRELLIRRLLRDVGLPYLRPVRDFPGFRGALADALEEVRNAGLEPDLLEKALSSGSLSQRHHSFVRLLRLYGSALRQAGADDGQRLSRALAVITGGGLPLGLLLVDGFSDFTAEQRQLLAALLKRAPAATVALTLDPHQRDFFYQAERSRAWLREAGCTETWLEGNHRARAEALKAVECALREGRAEEPPPLWQQEGALAVFAGADRRDEAELIGREILRLARHGFRYREIGIIVRRPEEYAPLLRGVFRRLGIPLRAFFPVPLADTAYGRHLRLCLDLFVPRSRPESLIEWLKSPYCPVRSRRLVECFEYQAARHFAEAREGRWDAFLKPDHLLASEVARIAEFEGEITQPVTPRALAAWTARMWRDLGPLKEIPDGASPERVLELRAEAAVCRRMESLLEEVVEAAEAENFPEMSFAEFRELLLSLMGEEQFPARDRRQDAVNLMNPFEARQWELRVVFVAGLVEKEFPALAHEPLFLDDSDRQRIEQAERVSLPTTAQRALDERLLFYLAATRARERLYLTYPQTDAGGKMLLRSFFLRDLDALLKSPACRMLERRRSEIACPPELAAGAADLLALVHAELARWPERKTLGGALALYERLRDHPATKGATSRAVAALAPRPGRLLRKEALDLLKEQAVRFSASDLRLFASCPFRYFAQKSLGLKGPAEPKEFDPLLEGNIAHSTIQEWERSGRGKPIGEVLERCFRETMEREGIPEGHLAAMVHKQMHHLLERFAQAEQQHDGVYRTKLEREYVELTFGGKEGTPALQLRLDPNTVIEVPGRVDRVEAVSAEGKRLGLVVDYKYSNSGFEQKSLDGIQEGLELQLPIYLLALRDLFGLVPAGAEIYPLKADESARCGVYDASLVPHIFQGDPPPGAIELAPETFGGLMTTGRTWIERHAIAIRDGLIVVSPKSERQCGNCEIFDLCRVTPWEVRQEQERAMSR